MNSGLEAAVALLLLLWFLCAKPEYGLFAYGLALGFPDLALPLGTAINLRLDDGLMIFLMLRSFVWIPPPLVGGQRKIMMWQGFLVAACFSSAAIGFANGVPPAGYETIKMIGCAVIALAIPRVVYSERRLRFLIAGLVCAGVALAVQMILRIGASPASLLSNFQEFKSAATFVTWNPNTIGQAAMLLVFAGGLGWSFFSKTRLHRMFWFSLSVAFALMAVMVFVRGTSVSILAGYLLFLCLMRSWKSVVLLVAICLSVGLYSRALNRDFVESATSINLASGEGLSHRFERWSAAIEAVEANPILGQGFAQEWNYLSAQGSEGRAHNAYLSIWIELGLGGLALLLAVIYQFVSVGLSLYRQPKFQVHGALVLSLIAAVCLDSFGLPTLYWEKIPTISLSIAAAVIGICERRALNAVPHPARVMEISSVPQHS